MGEPDLADRVNRLADRSKARRAELVAEAAVVERDRAEAVEVKRQAMRAQMPVIAGVVDAFNGVFGEGSVRVLYASENGIEVRTKAYRAP